MDEDDKVVPMDWTDSENTEITPASSDFLTQDDDSAQIQSCSNNHEGLVFTKVEETQDVTLITSEKTVTPHFARNHKQEEKPNYNRRESRENFTSNSIDRPTMNAGENVYLPFQNKERWIKISKRLTAFNEKLSELIAQKKYDKLMLKLYNVIKSYNPTYNGEWCNFKIFEQISYWNFEDITYGNISLWNILPCIIKAVLETPQYVTSEIKVLEVFTNAEIKLSQKQIHCLLANAFFCTYERPSNKGSSEYKYPGLNFIGLYNADTFDNDRIKPKIEKLKCILNYFHRTKDLDGNGHLITFRRKYLSTPIEILEMSLAKLIISSNGSIEQNSCGMLEVDFANKLVGGGILGNGSVMEEIRFSLSPELIVSRLFTQELTDREVLFISGTERFNSYTGYAKTFKFEGNYTDKRKLETHIVAMDALRFSREFKVEQFMKTNIDRELWKCVTAFQNDLGIDTIATGNWGCGVFNGDPELKAMIQLIAASITKKTLIYHTFGDQSQTESLNFITKLLNEKHLNAKQLYELIVNFNTKNVDSKHNTLFDFIKNEALAQDNELEGINVGTETKIQENLGAGAEVIENLIDLNAIISSTSVESLEWYMESAL